MLDSSAVGNPCRLPPAPCHEDESMTQRFAFDAAIEAHREWMRRLDGFVHGGAADQFDLDSASDFNHCALGLWLSRTVLAHGKDGTTLVEVRTPAGPRSAGRAASSAGSTAPALRVRPVLNTPWG